MGVNDCDASPAPTSPEHWNDAYAAGGYDVSWFQDHAGTSLDLIEFAVSRRETAMIDVGGGASTLVDGLLAEGFTDLTVLDLSADALAIARRRLGAAADRVAWIAADLLSWRPERAYGLWHDRAVLHFLIDDDLRARYLSVLDDALAKDGVAVIGVFAEDGPERCSNLPVHRYSPDESVAFLGDRFEILEQRREEHRTPSGRPQPFNWTVARKLAADQSS